MLGQGDHLDHRNTSGMDTALGLHPHLMSVPSEGGGERGQHLHRWWESTAACLSCQNYTQCIVLLKTDTAPSVCALGMKVLLGFGFSSWPDLSLQCQGINFCPAAVSRALSKGGC